MFYLSSVSRVATFPKQDNLFKSYIVWRRTWQSISSSMYHVTARKRTSRCASRQKEGEFVEDGNNRRWLGSVPGICCWRAAPCPAPCCFGSSSSSPSGPNTGTAPCFESTSSRCLHRILRNGSSEARDVCAIYNARRDSSFASYPATRDLLPGYTAYFSTRIGACARIRLAIFFISELIEWRSLGWFQTSPTRNTRRS